jgi:cytochrome c oxidase subunit IV
MTSTTAHDAEQTHIVGYGTFIKVWGVLVALTGALVALSASHRPNLALLGLLVITPTKASLVLFYFMHLKYESTALKYMVVAAITVLVIFVGLTFADYLYR